MGDHSAGYGVKFTPQWLTFRSDDSRDNVKSHSATHTLHSTKSANGRVGKTKFKLLPSGVSSFPKPEPPAATYPSTTNNSDNLSFDRNFPSLGETSALPSQRSKQSKSAPTVWAKPKDASHRKKVDSIHPAPVVAQPKSAPNLQELSRARTLVPCQPIVSKFRTQQRGKKDTSSRNSSRRGYGYSGKTSSYSANGTSPRSSQPVPKTSPRPTSSKMRVLGSSGKNFVKLGSSGTNLPRPAPTKSPRDLSITNATALTVEAKPGVHANGTKPIKVPETPSISSLEEEERLLRSLGWEPDASDEGEGLTEEEIRAFENNVKLKPTRMKVRGPDLESSVKIWQEKKFSNDDLSSPSSGLNNEEGDDLSSESDDDSSLNITA